MKEIVLQNKEESLNIIEKFVEEICEGYNIGDSFLGNMLIAITEVVSLIEEQDSALKILFKNINKKFVFEFSEFRKDIEINFFEEDVENFVMNSDMSNSVFMINALCDDIKIDKKYNKIVMEFINAGVDEVVSIHRKQYLSKYLNQQVKV